MLKGSGAAGWHVALRGLALAGALVLAGCGQAPALTHTYNTPDALVGAVLDAIASRNRSALEAIALSESEFREMVWPQLPAARPDRNLPWDYVWKDLRQKSLASLAQMLAEHGGRRYELVTLQTIGATTHYRGFEVARDTELTVTDQTGKQRPIRLFGSIISAGGRYKLFSYVTD